MVRSCLLGSAWPGARERQYPKSYADGEPDAGQVAEFWLLDRRSPVVERWLLQA